MATSPLLGLLALFLVFVLPGLGLTAAVFPERIRPARDRGRQALEVVALTLLASVSITVLLGELLQTVGPGFSASWSDPRLELLDLLIGGVGLVIGGARGAFRRGVDPGTQPPGDPAWETLRTLERLSAEERAIGRSLRRSDLSEAERRSLEQRRRELAEARRDLGRRREAEYAA